MKKIDNEERAILELIEGLKKRVENEKNSVKLKIYREALFKLQKRYNEIYQFKTTIGGRVFKTSTEDYLKRFFNKANLIFSSGYDYYYASPIVEKIANGDNLAGESTSIDVLLNEEQFSVLKKGADCEEDIDFISYQQDDEERYALWLKDTQVSLNLIPFKREKDKGMTLKDRNGKEVHYSKEQARNFVNPTNGEYRGLEFKRLSKSGYEMRYGRMIKREDESEIAPKGNERPRGLNYALLRESRSSLIRGRR